MIHLCFFSLPHLVVRSQSANEQTYVAVWKKKKKKRSTSLQCLVQEKGGPIKDVDIVQENYFRISLDLLASGT